MAWEMKRAILSLLSFPRSVALGFAGRIGLSYIAMGTTRRTTARLLTIQPPPSVVMSQYTCTRWLRSPLMEMV